MAIIGKIGKFGGNMLKNMAIGAATGYVIDKFAAPVIEKKIGSYLENKMNNFDMSQSLNKNAESFGLGNIISGDNLNTITNISGTKNKIESELGSKASTMSDKLTNEIKNKSDNVINGFTGNFEKTPNQIVSSINTDSLVRQYDNLSNLTDNSTYKKYYESLKDYYNNKRSSFETETNSIIQNAESRFDNIDINDASNFVNEHSGNIGSMINSSISNMINSINENTSSINTGE